MINRHRFAVAGLALAMFSLAAQAGETSSSAKNPVATGCGHNPGPWDTSIYSGLALTQGTVDSLTLNAGILAKGSWSADELTLMADYLYGDTNGAKTNNAFRAGAQYNHLLTERFYIGLTSGFLYDEIADIDYRVNAYPTLGYYLIKNDTTKLGLEAGVGYTWEKQGGRSDDFVGARFGERFEHTFASGAKFYQLLEYIPRIDDWNDYLLAAEVGFEVPVTAKLSWRTAARDSYDSSPALGRDANDFTLLTGLSYALGAAPAPNKCKVCRAIDASKPAPPPPQGTWITTGSIGFSLTSGNSDNSLVQAGIDTVRYTETDETRFGVGGGYGEVNGSTNVQNFHANAQYNRVLSAPWYAGVRTDFLHDEIASVDYRVTPAAVLGAYLVKTDTTKLSLEAGPAGTWQKQGGVSDSFFSVIAQQRLEMAINGRTKIWEAVGGLLNTSDTSDYIITAEAGVDLKISTALSLRVVAQNLYDAKPAAGADSNEFRLTSGLAITF